MLPIGISFYTFHTISYIVDSYRSVIRPTRNFFEFSAYVSLFSQLVAGPIVRFRQIEEDLESIGHADRTRWLPRGVPFFIVGLVEKVLVADTLAGFVDPGAGELRTLSTLGAWLADARLHLPALLRLLRLQQHGRRPGLPVRPPHPAELQLALQGDSIRPTSGGAGTSRCRPACATTSTSRSAAIARGSADVSQPALTMLIGGLWHGASWTFVVWGAYHGVLLALHRRSPYSGILCQER